MSNFIDRKDFYRHNRPDLVEKTKDRLTRIHELGMTLVGVAEFGIKGIMSGLYIEKVWNLTDGEFDSYLDWVKGLKEKGEPKIKRNGIQLKKIKTWEEKSKDNGFNSGTLRIYAGGNIHVGWAEPVRLDKDNYYYRSRSLEGIVNVPNGRLSLEEIVMYVELSLKEFIKKVAIVSSVSTTKK